MAEWMSRAFRELTRGERGAQGHAQSKLLLWRGDWGVGCSCRVRRRVHRGSMNRGKRNDSQPSRSSSTRTTTSKAPPRTKPTQSPRSCFNVRRAPSSPRRDGHDHRGCTQAMWQGALLNDTRHDPALSEPNPSKQPRCPSRRPSASSGRSRWGAQKN